MIDKVSFKSFGLLRFWYILAAIQLTLFVIATIITAAMNDMDGLWFFDFLTLVSGKKIATIGVIVNLAITSVDFYVTNIVLKEVNGAMRKHLSFKEMSILKKMRKFLKYILISLVVSWFAQILVGVLWWIIGAAVLVFKYFYYKQLNELQKA